MRHNQFINTNFTKLITRIPKPSYGESQLTNAPSSLLCHYRAGRVDAGRPASSARATGGAGGGESSSTISREITSDDPATGNERTNECVAKIILSRQNERDERCLRASKGIWVLRYGTNDVMRGSHAPKCPKDLRKVMLPIKETTKKVSREKTTQHRKNARVTVLINLKF